MSALATRQHGVASADQMRRLGLDASGIARRVRAGRLHRLHQGVYAVGHRALSLNGRQLAAVLAAGSGGLLGYRSAARLWDLIRHSGAIEVTSPRSRKPQTGFTLHTSRRLTEADRAVVAGIPVTTVARTLVDLAEVVNEHRLSKAINQAEIQGRFDLAAVRAALARVPGRTGRHRLMRVLRMYEPAPAVTRSENERRFLEVCDRQGIPRPLSNKSRAGYELDLLWPGHGLAVEVDDPAIHHTMHSYHADRRRDRALAAHDIHVIRVTPLDLENERELAEELLRILATKAA